MELTEDELKPGLILGRYELLAPVAKGGMAQVWVARLTGTRGFQKTVAIKTMLPNLSEDPQFEQMFLDEASLASRVRHPNAVEIMDLGEDAGILYLVMEWIEGEPLSILLKQAAKQGGIPLSLAVRIVMQACGGLHAAHELKDDDGEPVGLVHRDVSPQNILVSYSGVVKVVDFGVAKATGRVSEQTSAGQIKGKVPYMSPEQASGGIIDRRTDVFAMGILLYMMTTGKHPFRKENDAQTMLNICSDARVVPPSAVTEDYPSELEEIVQKSLAKGLDARYQSAAEMQKALDGLPRELRASTEEDLGVFMRNLLSERMEKRRGLIQSALKDADHRAEGRKTTTIDVIEERSGGGHTPLSGVSRLSSYEGVPSASTPSTSAHLAVVSETERGSTSAMMAAQPKKRRLLPIIGGLVLGGGIALGLFLILRAAPAAPGGVAGQPSGAPVVAGAPEKPSAAAPTAVMQVTDLEAADNSGIEIVEEIDLDAPDPKEAAKAAAPTSGRVGRRAAAPPAKAAAPPAAKPPAPSAEAKPAAPKSAAGKPFISPFANPDF